MLGLVLVGYFMTIVGQTILESERRMRSKHQKRVTTALTKMAEQRFHSFDKFRSFFRSGSPFPFSFISVRSIRKSQSPSLLGHDIENPVHHSVEQSPVSEDSLSIAAAYNISFDYEMMVPSLSFL
jgi:hypothetical protein